jgi:hypothetical protein
MPQDHRNDAQRRSNVRLGLLFGALALAFFVAIIVEQVLGR